MLKAYIRWGDGHISHDTDDATLARAVRDPECFFWLDMAHPTDEELGLLDEAFGFHPLAIEDSIQYAQRPKIESYRHTGAACSSGYFYMVFHGPDLAAFRQRLRTKELDLFVSDRYLVTIHDEQMMSVDAVLARVDADPRMMLERGIDVLLYYLLDKIVDNYEPILDYLQDALDNLEERALTDPRPELLTDIAVKKRELLNLRRIVAPQREVVAQLTRGDVPFIREGTRVYLRDVQDHLIRVVELVELYRDLVTGARDIYLSSLSNNLNQVMKTLTIITVVALPMSIITSFFGMNFNAETVHAWGWLLNNRWSFWISLLVIVLLVAALLALFWRKGWLGSVRHSARRVRDTPVETSLPIAGPPRAEPAHGPEAANAGR